MGILRGIKLGSALGALALFFLPWVDIQCSGKSLATQTGLQAIVGMASEASGLDSRQPQTGDEKFGSADMVAAALIATGLAAICLFISLLNRKWALDAMGSALCAVALLCLLVQLGQGFPVKEALVQDASVDNASLDMDSAASLENSMAFAAMESLQIKLLPAFVWTCILLGIPGLLTIPRLLIHGSAIHRLRGGHGMDREL